MSLLDVALTREWVAERWLVGVSLVNPTTGEPFPTALFNHAIRQGREQAEGEFDLSFDPTTVTGSDGLGEAIDLTDWSASSDYLTNLLIKPLISVDEVSFYNGNTKVWTVPPEWILVPAAKFSQIQLKEDGVTRPALTSGFVSGFMPRSYRASQMRVKYTAGYPEVDVGTVYALKDSDKVTGVGTTFKSTLKLGDFIGFVGETEAYEEARVVTRIVSNTEARVDRPWSASHGSSTGPTLVTMYRVRIQSILLEYAGILAARTVLITAGDLVIGAGIANISRSIDGLSQSIGTTASAENSAYSARIKLLDTQLQTLYKRVMRDFRPADCFII